MEALTLASSLSVCWTAARALRHVPLMQGAQGLYELVLPALELEQHLVDVFWGRCGRKRGQANAEKEPKAERSGAA